jgi:hypothetical protein
MSSLMQYNAQKMQMQLKAQGDQDGNRQTNQAVHGSSNQAPSSSLTVTTRPIQAHRSFAERAAASRACPYEGVRAGEVIGWRYWRVHGRILLSVITATPWIPGEVMEGDVSMYGIHAYKTREGLMENWILGPSMVWGTVYMWGDIVEHETGYRSQYASIRSLSGWAGMGRYDKIMEQYLPNGNPCSAA